MPTLYGVSPSPFVRKVRYLLAEKKIDYDHKPILPFNVDDTYKKISPLGKIPAYQDDDVILADSSVICAYLEKKYPNPSLYPSNTASYAQALWFEEYGDTVLSQAILPNIFFQKLVGPALFNQPTNEALVTTALNETLPPLYDYLENIIGEKIYLVGDQLSIADIGVGSPFINLYLSGFEVDAAKWPKLASYLEHLMTETRFAELIKEDKLALAKLSS